MLFFLLSFLSLLSNPGNNIYLHFSILFIKQLISFRLNIIDLWFIICSGFSLK